MLYALLRLLPKNHFSSFFGWLAAIRLPRPFAGLVLRCFVSAVRIDPSDAEHPLSEYGSIAEFFVRRLGRGARPIGAGLVSAVDGFLRSCGRIQAGVLPQVKNKTYLLHDFLHDDELARRFRDGFYFNLYLSPRDYHRVHAPESGRIVSRRHVPGKLWPVNDWSLSHIDNLFSVNERVIVEMQCEQGRMLVVFVGATNVGKISLSFDELITNRRGATYNTRTFTEGVSVKKGEELGVFHLGSSVVILLDPTWACGSEQFPAPAHFKMGETLIALESKAPSN